MLRSDFIPGDCTKIKPTKRKHGKENEQGRAGKSLDLRYVLNHSCRSGIPALPLEDRLQIKFKLTELIRKDANMTYLRFGQIWGIKMIKRRNFCQSCIQSITYMINV